jgi:cytochrome c551/c552
MDPSRRKYARALCAPVVQSPPSAQRSMAQAIAIALVAIGAAIAPLRAQDAEPSKTLIPGKGSDLTTARCATCHDAQHITRAKLSRGEWEFNIKNMIERGAPIAPAEIPVILDYLAIYYNRDQAAPAPDPAAAGFGTNGESDPEQRLLTANACVACHQAEQRVVGPSYREIATKYAGNAEANASLVKKIKEGGAGNWGNVPMPPHTHLSDVDLNQMVSWILKQR